MSATRRPTPRVLRWLLKLLPFDFRDRFGAEIEETFQDQRDEISRKEQKRLGLLHLWLVTAAGIVRTAPAQHVDMLRADTRFALRTMRREAGFTLVAVLTLALGIGVNTAVFSTVSHVLLEPLPYRDPERLALVWTRLPQIGLARNWVSTPEIVDLREQTRLFEGFGVAVGNDATLIDEGNPERITVGVVSANLFPLLGVGPLRGRGFEAADEDENGPPVAILSHELWQRRYGGSLSMLGRLISLDDTDYTVVGIMPPGFNLVAPAATRLPGQVTLWTPLQVDYAAQDRHSHGLTGFARLRPGVSLAQGQAELDALAARLLPLHYTETGFGLLLTSLHDELVGGIRPALLALLGAVSFVLLIACANVANLLLARAAARRREMAVRASLGADLGRLARQVITESSLLAVLGGLGGLGVAAAGIRGLVWLAPRDLPRFDSIAIDGGVLLFTTGVSLLTGFVFGLAPTLHLVRAELTEDLKGGDRGSSQGPASSRLRAWLVAGEIGLSLILLISAGLMMRTLHNVGQIRPGFDADNLLTVRVGLPPARYPDEATAPFFSRLEETVGALPGVVAVGANMQLPLGRSSWSGTDTFYEASNGAAGGVDTFEVDQRVVTAGYFSAIGTELIAGRAFDGTETRDTAPVVVIDETLAARVWPGQSAIGKRMARGRNPEDPPLWEVIGVVEHVRNHDLTADGREQVYFAHGQLQFRELSLVVRTTGEPLDALDSIRGVVREMDPTLPVYAVGTMRAYLDSAAAPARFLLTVLAVFALIGIALAGFGIFGVVSYAVRQRTREFEIRMAVGARPADIVRLVLREGLLLTVLGVAGGLVGAIALTRYLESSLVGVNATDPPTIGLMIGLVIGATLLACWHPARRAAAVDVTRSVRGE